MTRLITAADLCDGVEAVLVEQLWEIVGIFNLQETLKQITDWHQLPTIEALTTANTPAGAITSPGLASDPTRHGGRIDAVWRVVVGIYDRDADHTATAHRTRVWAGLVRACVLRNPRLGGIASGVTWVGERYEVIPARAAARTLGGCAVSFNVSAKDVVDVDDLGELPIVLETHPSLTVHRGEIA